MRFDHKFRSTRDGLITYIPGGLYGDERALFDRMETGRGGLYYFTKGEMHSPVGYKSPAKAVEALRASQGRCIWDVDTLRQNPISTRAKIAKAEKLRAGFRDTATGVKPKTSKLSSAKMKVDKVQMSVGVVEAIEYTVLDNKGRRIKGSSFRHEFTGQSCPTLTCSSDGTQLYFVGGRYKFKTDGINDIK